MLPALLAASVPVCAQTSATAPVKPHAGMLRYPTVSASEIAFIYAGKLWRVPRAGGLAIPVANPPGAIAYPKFSPDGKTLAFSANYDGNLDLYTLDAEGGANPFRVTHHPGADVLYSWAPGGKLIFGNAGYNGINRTTRLLSVGQTGGLPMSLPVPYGEDAMVSPDGRYLAYTPSSTNTRTWKRYRGGWAQDIWLMDLQDKSAKKITDWEGTDTLPMWSGDRLFYLSDGGPEHRLNLWEYQRATGKKVQVTRFADYDVKFPSVGGGAIVFQHGADLMLLDINSGQAHAVNVTVPGDKPGVRTRVVDAARYITSWSISPSGKRVAVNGRGDVWTLPAKDGSPRNLTHSDGSNERDANWSPDGKSIAYLSDATGEMEVYLMPSDGKVAAKQLTHGAKGFRYLLNWSPDSKSLLMADSAGYLYTIDATTGTLKTVFKNTQGNPPTGRWSHDSRYLTYATQKQLKSLNAVYVYDTQTGETRQVTSGMFDDTDPVFDRKGDYLYFASKRVYNRPTYDASMTSWVYTGTQTLVALPLRADMPSPFAPKSDEEAEVPAATVAPTNPTAQPSAPADDITGTWSGTVQGTPIGDVPFNVKLALAGTAISGTVSADAFGTGSVSGTFDPNTKKVTLTLSLTGVPPIQLSGSVANGQMSLSGNVAGTNIALTLTRAQAGAMTPAAAGATKPAAPSAPTKALQIDWDGMESRAFQLPVQPGTFSGLSVNAQNALLFIRSSPETGVSLKAFDLNDTRRDEKTVAAGASFYDLSADGKKLLVGAGAGASIQDAVPGATAEAVPMTGLSVTVEPVDEWREIYNEAWRIERDMFYDPSMHGVNWQKIHDDYAAMLPYANSRADVGYIISEMISELNIGHAYYSGGDADPQPFTPIGSLGCDFEMANGAYRISKIYRGAAWDTDAIGPLSQPGVKIKEGDYLLAVNGVPIDPKQDPWASLVGLADRTVTLTVSASPKLDSAAREVVVRTLGSDSNLRYRAWIEHNRAYVDKATGGRVGYIYVPNTGTDGQSDLVRQFIGQMGKDALIIDERWNAGGQIPTRFIELLNRPVTNYWARRDADDWVWPPDGHNGPKCMLINGLSGSGGDAFPWYFRQAGLGKLIGTRTWGGLVGITGYPPLLDGAQVTAPDFAFYKKDGTWGIEGNGVEPDLAVLDDPSKMQNGGDPQLDAGIKQMLDELKTHPYVAPKRPKYPNKAGMGMEKKDI